MTADQIVAALSAASDLKTLYAVRASARDYMDLKRRNPYSNGFSTQTLPTAEVEAKCKAVYRGEQPNSDGKQFGTGPYYVGAIKEYRHLTGTDLKSAKDWVDARKVNW